MSLSPYYKGVCVEQSVKIAVFAKCLQVFKEFGRVGRLRYLCSVNDSASRAQNERNCSFLCRGTAYHRQEDKPGRTAFFIVLNAFKEAEAQANLPVL